MTMAYGKNFSSELTHFSYSKFLFRIRPLVHKSLVFNISNTGLTFECMYLFLCVWLRFFGSDKLGTKPNQHYNIFWWSNQQRLMLLNMNFWTYSIALFEYGSLMSEYKQFKTQFKLEENSYDFIYNTKINI